jgi:AAA domain-containing protein
MNVHFDYDKILEHNKFAIYTILQRDDVVLVDRAGKIVFRFGAQLTIDQIKQKLREYPEAIARIHRAGKFVAIESLWLTAAQEIFEAELVVAKAVAKAAELESPPDDDPPPPAARAPLHSVPAPEPETAAPTIEEIDRVSGGTARAKPEPKPDQRQRSGGEQQQRDEAKQGGDDSTESTKPGVILICAADVEAEPIEWLWPDRFALGKIGMIAGEGAGGKSQITIDMAARITTGREWPNDEGIAPTGNVIFLSAEDDLKDTLVPRLMAAGADLAHVFFVDAVKDTPALGSRRRLFNVTKDVARLCEAIDRIGNVRLVVIDPITAYLGSGKEVDSHKAADVRDALNPLKDYAEKLNFTGL